MKGKLIAVAFALLAAVFISGCAESGPSFQNTDITGAPFGRDFELLDPDGHTRTLADFHGRAVLVFFGFIHCPDVCPTALARAAEVRHLLGEDAGKLQVVFVSLDPERDSPALLKEYTAAFDADFLGLYSSLEGTKKVADEFRVFYRKVPTGGSYSLDHTATSYVFDPQGRLRLAVAHQSSAASIAADLRQLL